MYTHINICIYIHKYTNILHTYLYIQIYITYQNVVALHYNNGREGGHTLAKKSQKSALQSLHTAKYESCHTQYAAKYELCHTQFFLKSQLYNRCIQQNMSYVTYNMQQNMSYVTHNMSFYHTLFVSKLSQSQLHSHCIQKVTS